MTQTYRLVDGFQILVTTLMKGHERIESEVPLPAYSKPQEWASATTYVRRVSLMAIAGVCGDDDDDAEVAMERNAPKPPAKPAVPAGFDDWWSELGDTVSDGAAALEQFWLKSDKAFRAHVMANHQDIWAKMKSVAGGAK